MVPAGNRTRSLALSGAEALIRIRHPTWGIVPPAYFIPGDGDPHFRALSDFVIRRAIDDWRYFVSQLGGIEVAINLPVAFLQDSESVKNLCEQLPDHPAFQGLIVEINGTEVVRGLEQVTVSRGSFGSTISASRSMISGRNGPCSSVGMIFPSSRSRSIESSSPVVPTTD